jgi:hypothetical protein
MIRRSVVAVASLAASGAMSLVFPWPAQAAATWQVTSAVTAAVPDAANDAWGLTTTSGGTTFAAHWNGSTWTTTQLPATAQELAIGADGASDVWVVGRIGASGYNRHQPYMLHFDGSSWTSFGLPDDGANESLTSVAVFSPSDAWASGPNVLAHWDGTAWSRVTAPASAGATGAAQLTHLVRSGANLWALGTATVSGSQVSYAALRNGTSWTLTPSMPAAPSGEFYFLTGISATSASNVWVSVTADNEATQATSALALHWNGSSWASFPMPANGVHDTLHSIAAGSGEAWAVGTYEKSFSNNGDRAAVYHWNGSSWSIVSFPVTTTPSSADIAAYVPGTSTAWIAGGTSTGDFTAIN